MGKRLPLRAVIFDADGTIMNTGELIRAAYAHVTATHQLRTVSPEELHSHMGKSLRDICIGLFPESNPDDLLATNDKFIVDNAARSMIYDGLHDLLGRLRSDGLQLAILTGGGSRVEDLLQYHDIRHFFGSIVHSERIQKQKPDPEGLLLALHELGVTPDEAIMVGDMRHDIGAGKGAGARASIGLTHGFGAREELERAGADYIVDSLIELDTLLHRLANARTK
jgi:pyrophosphatase PpaX